MAPLLLASATDAGETATALAGGADIVDLKDPERGVLGACELRTLAAAAAARDRIAPGRPLSAATGSLRADGVASFAAAAARLGFDYLKTGLDGIADGREAAARLRAVAALVRAAAPATRLIAASYADAAAVGALAPADLPAAAAGFDGCLVDTAVKDGRGLLRHLDVDALARFVGDCRARGLLAAVAGSIAAPDLPAVVATGPDIIGARGALCAGGRRGRLDGERLRAFHAAILSAVSRPPSIA